MINQNGQVLKISNFSMPESLVKKLIKTNTSVGDGSGSAGNIGHQAYFDDIAAAMMATDNPHNNLNANEAIGNGANDAIANALSMFDDVIDISSGFGGAPAPFGGNIAAGNVTVAGGGKNNKDVPTIVASAPLHGDLDAAPLSESMSKRVSEFVNENLTDDGAKVLPWHRLLTMPPRQMIVVERMHSGARRSVTLDFGQPIILTDVVSAAATCRTRISIS